MTTIRQYAEDLRTGKKKLSDIPPSLRKDVISILRELLAVTEAENEKERNSVQREGLKRERAL